jgi:hypothetical protein
MSNSACACAFDRLVGLGALKGVYYTQVMKLTRKTYTSRTEKIVDFVIGFVGWFILTALSGLISLVAITPSGAITNIPTYIWLFALITGAGPCIVYPAWVVILAVLFRWRQWLALGGATAFALALVAVGAIGLAAGQILEGWE